MEKNTSLTPYRTAALAVRPVDESLVPDCGREETALLGKRFDETESEVRKKVGNIAVLHFLAVTNITALTLMAALIVSGVPAWLAAYSAFMTSLLINVLSVGYSCDLFASRIMRKNPEVLRLLEHKKDLQERPRSSGQPRTTHRQTRAFRTSSQQDSAVQPGHE